MENLENQELESINESEEINSELLNTESSEIEVPEVEIPKEKKKKTNKKSKAKPGLQVGHDPKNREVLILSEDKIFVVTKVETGFASDPLESLKEAQVIFEFQISCSQNQ